MAGLPVGPAMSSLILSAFNHRSLCIVNICKETNPTFNQDAANHGSTNFNSMNINSIERKIHRIWWVPLITGIIALGLGIWCFWAPASSMEVLAFVFSAGIILAGILNISYAIVNSALDTNWGWSLVLGILEVVCGVWLCTVPGPQLTIAFAYAAGIWVLVASIMSIGEALFFSRYSFGWAIGMIVLLIFTCFFGFYILLNPFFSGFVGWVWIGCSLLFFGVWRICLAFKIRSLNKYI